MQHKQILAQGGTIHYWINKKRNTADNIVFTHGLTADHTMFEKQAAFFPGNIMLFPGMSLCMDCQGLIKIFPTMIQQKYYIIFCKGKILKKLF